MNSCNFDRMTEEEKMYCCNILSKYRSPPKFEEPFPERVREYWDEDKVKENFKEITVWEYKKIPSYVSMLEQELKKDCHAFIEWMIPCIFRFCKDNMICCTGVLISTMISSVINANGHSATTPKLMSKSGYDNILCSICCDNLENVRFTYPQFLCSRIKYDTIGTKWVLQSGFQNYSTAFHKTLLSSDWATTDKAIKERDLHRESCIKSNPYCKPQFELEDYNREKYTQIAKDINRMLCAVETQTPYKEVCHGMTDDYTPFLEKINIVLTKRLKKTFVDNENKSDHIDLETDQILTILYHLRINSLTGDKRDVARYRNMFKNYLDKLDKEQLQDICLFFSVQYESLTKCSIMCKCIIDIFEQVELPAPQDLSKKIDSIKEDTAKIMEMNETITEHLASLCRSTDDIWTIVKTEYKPEAYGIKYPESFKQTFAQSLYENLTRFLRACDILSSGKISGTKPLEFTIAEELASFVNCKWLVSSIGTYSSTHKAKRISKLVKYDEISELSSSVVKKVVELYSSQLSEVEPDYMDFLGEHAVLRMIKYLNSNSNSTNPIEQELICSLYRVDLKDSIRSKCLNKNKWTANGMFSRVGIEKDGKKYVHKDRLDAKYGFISIDQDIPDTYIEYNPSV